MDARPLGQFEHLLLYAIQHLQRGDEGASGPSIRKLIERQTGRVISPGAAFTALDRLERRGLLRSELGDPTPERGGKRKRIYEMRPAGAAALRTADASLQRMSMLARSTE